MCDLREKTIISFIIFKMTMSMISVVEAIIEVRVQIELPTIENLISLRVHILKKSNLIFKLLTSNGEKSSKHLNGLF